MTHDLFTRSVQEALGTDFLSKRLSADFAFADVGAESVQDLLTWRDFSELLSTRPLAPPRLRLHREGTPVPAERYTELGDSSGAATRVVRPDALYRELREGASLVVDAVDRLHPPIRRATDDLMRWVRERAQVNLYAIWGDSRGFDTHWDDHDTFIVQLRGTKHWQVHGQGTRPYPLKVDSDHAHRPPEETVWEGVLRPGHVLHVPRGWWHTVTGTGEASMHLTFGFAPPTGIDWARSLVDALHDSELFRRDLPRFADHEERAEHHAALLRRLAELAGTHDLEAFLSEHEDRFPRRRRFALPWGVEDTPAGAQAVVEFVPILSPAVQHVETENGSKVRFTVSGRRYTFPAEAEPVLRALGERRVLSVAQLAEASGREMAQVRSVVTALVRQHLAVVDPAD
jgi:hypothetical protein